MDGIIKKKTRQDEDGVHVQRTGQGEDGVLVERTGQGRMECSWKGGKKKIAR